jgi:hypothetical protein
MKIIKIVPIVALLASPFANAFDLNDAVNTLDSVNKAANQLNETKPQIKPATPAEAQPISAAEFVNSNSKVNDSEVKKLSNPKVMEQSKNAVKMIPEKCDDGGKTVFSCLTDSGKIIQLCNSGKKISYSFGKKDEKSDIVVSVPHSKATTFQGGNSYSSKYYSIDVPNGNTIYRVFLSWDSDYSASDYNSDGQFDGDMTVNDVSGGVEVQIKHKVAATIKCSNQSLPHTPNTIDEFNKISGVNLKEKDLE